MELMYRSEIKTVPSNYSRKGMELMEDIQPGASCTPEQWKKAERMESPFYDWAGYETLQRVRMDHPDFVAKQEQQALFDQWNEKLNELEPMGR